MSKSPTVPVSKLQSEAIPLPILIIFRGIGQVFFQENALTGVLFVLGILLSSPIMAVGAVAGSAVGTFVAYALKFDQDEIQAGLFGFNSALVGIASFFFFPIEPMVIGMMVSGCVIAALLTKAMRQYIPIPTYTTAFIVTTWCIYLLGNSLEISGKKDYPALLPDIELGFYATSAAHGVSQVMFQASIWTCLLFLLGIAINDKAHALLVVIGSLVGMAVAVFHFTLGADSIDPERLVLRPADDTIKLGLYGYNATLVAIALFLSKKPVPTLLLGMALAVPLTEWVPIFGIPALTAPFVLAVWVILAIEWFEEKWLVN